MTAGADTGAQAAATSSAYLGVDDFLRTLIDARTLKTAFELGLIDALAAGDSMDAAALGARFGIDERGLDVLLALLAANRVIGRAGGQLRLTPAFEAILRYRDLLETKLDFAGFLLDDFADLFTDLIRDPARFAETARLYQLFDYRRALRDEGDNYQRTRSWMQLTSALSRYEAAAALEVHDFAGYRRMLDVGGNSGEFALQLCRAHATLEATIADLPLVCEIGLEHVMGDPAAARIGFLPLDLREDPLPRGYDLIVFKSMLHDWPETMADRFLERAVDALEPGGTLLIYERLPLGSFAATPPFSMLPILLFFRSYRDPSAYETQLRRLGLGEIDRLELDLDTRFAIMSARRP